MMYELNIKMTAEVRTKVMKLLNKLDGWEPTQEYLWSEVAE